MEEKLIPKDIAERIKEYERYLDRWSYYEMLYITQNASVADIKKAYRKLVALMHPDKYGISLSPEDKQKLEFIFNELNNAYSTLTNESERIKYDQSLYRVEDGQSVKLSTDEQVAQAQYKRGVLALQKNDIVPAIEFFKSAINLDSTKSEYYAKLALAQISQQNPRLRKEALESCKEAIKMNQENPNYHALMGRIFQKLGDFENAEINYRRALSWNPHHAIARKELKVIMLEKRKIKSSSFKDKIKGFFIKNK
jgi:curved DNA-binding protein CbpA